MIGPNKFTTELFIKRSKEVHGDVYDYSQSTYTRATNKIDIICKKHGKFSQRAISHTSGKGCSKCGNLHDRHRNNTEYFIEQSRKIHGNRYDYSEVEYTTCGEKVSIICKEHGRFLQRAVNHYKTGQGCPKCGPINNGADRRRGTEEFIELARTVHGDEYDYSLVKYTTGTSPVDIICKHHGKFSTTPSIHLTGRKCYKCGRVSASKTVSSDTDTFISKARSVHGDIYDYSRVVYKHNKAPIEIICKEHGSFFQRPNKHLMLNGCPACGRTKAAASISSDTNTFLVEARKVHGEKYDYSNVNYNRSNINVEIICKEHGPFQQTPSCHLSGRGCKKCSNSQSSLVEGYFLDHLNIPRENRQISVGIYKVDGIDDNIVYEFLGDFWHGNPTIYNQDEMNVVIKKSYGELLKKTLDRFDKIESRGYKIKYIWESDWNNWIKNRKKGKIPLKTYRSKKIDISHFVVDDVAANLFYE